MPLPLPRLRPILRSLGKQPGFSTVAVLTLALGIGVNVAIFSAIEALVINPLPYPNANRLVAVYEDAAWLGYAKNTPALANFMDWKRESKSFEDMAATNSCKAVFTGDSSPEEIRCRNVTGNLMPMLGVRPILGRWFNPAEDHPSPDVVMIGEGLWTRRFARDPGILNRTVQMNGYAVRVVGVMPGWFHFGGDRDMELWMPSGFTPQQLARRTSHFLTCYGRLKPGVSVERAEAELRAIQARINQAHPQETDARMSARVESLSDALVGKMRGALEVLMGAAAMVLLIACANVANLLLARATGRQHEMAVRTSLGASSGDLLGQVFSETLVLTTLGGAAGILLALVSRRLLENFVPLALQGTITIGLDARVLVFAIAASLFAAALAAVTPILQVLHAPLMSLLRQDSRTGSSRTTVRLRGALVAGEVALTVALLAGAGLMIRSLIAIWGTDLGFNIAGLMSTTVSLPNSKYGTDQKRWPFYDQALERVRAIPGVAAADFASTPPFFSIGNSNGFAIEGRTPSGQWEPTDMLVRVATPTYLSTIGARLTAGRAFSAADREGAPDVAIVNESFAKTFFPNQSVLGKRMSLTQNDGQRRWRTIVGVVKEVNERGYDYAPKPATYVTVRQIDSWALGQLVVRASRGSPQTLLNSIRRAIQQVDPNQPLGLTRTFDEILALDQASRRQQMFLLIAFSTLSLVMACLGIFAILAYTVELRRQEIGIRLALGANSGQVMRLVTWHGMQLAGVGGMIGVAAAAIGGRMLRASLYEVQPFDPLTLGAVCGLLMLVALLACWIPSRRAAATSPLLALRQ
jgi:putative ABC transport system permease protein